MWFNILPSFLIVAASVGVPGLGCYWLHYLVNGNILQYSTGNTVSAVTFREKVLEFDFGIDLNKNMWYEILPSFVIITAGVGLPGWGLYHIHNLMNDNHFRRTMLERWERHQYQRDWRLTGNPYKVNGLEIIPDLEEKKPTPKKM